MERLVFLDPTGRRRRWVRRASGILLFCTAGLGTAFVLSLIIPALVAGWQYGIQRPALLPHQVPRQVALRRYLYRQARARLLRAIQQSERETRSVVRGQSTFVAAFYAPWQETGLHTLKANATHLTHLFPVWIALSPDGTRLDWSQSSLDRVPLNREVLRIARQAGLQIHPVLTNAGSSGFDAQRAHRLLSNETLTRQLAIQLRDWLRKNHYQGLNVDFESLSSGDYPAFVRFVQHLHQVLAAANLQLSVDIEASLPIETIRSLAEATDFVVLMLYDEHYQTGAPGPIASIRWSGQVLHAVLRYVPPQKVVVGLANYAYDWVEGHPAEVLSFSQALMRARDYRADEPPSKVIDFDPFALNATFEYMDEQGRRHEVWMLDAISFYNQWQVARRLGVRGVSLWVPGLEDPSVWSLLDRHHLDHPTVSALRTIHYPFDIEFDGEGEILTLRAAPARGERTLELDPATGLCTDVVYHRYPSPYLIRRWGYHPKVVALTFDDGPDPRYTPQILDILKAQGVKATFFIIGLNGEHYPALVHRLWEEGHEIGNHTFTHPNMELISEWRAELELNATQRLVQSLLGRSAWLFRPPYDADAEPTTAAQVRPIVVATKMGYLTIGELIDPADWQTEVSLPNGQVHHRTGWEIAQDTLRQLREHKGNVILLHDGGGDRSATVEALRLLIPELKRRGYRFVTIAELMGAHREQVMPPVQGEEELIAGVDYLVFSLMFWTHNILVVLFYGGLLLGVGRLLWVVPLALWGARRARRMPTPFSPTKPLVSVLIAAYNEQPVIERTLRAVLASTYPSLEVVVVDDGSTDGTAEEVFRHFGRDSRVRLIRQPNQGKGAALNRALQVAQGEVLICIDADTMLAPDAIERLVVHFTDPQVGAVAGNIRVGNPEGILALWQMIEYTVSQNLDRRAGALLNAVFVVPGALGAWRRRAVMQVGGYETDTLAEDMDLTWRLRMAGWRIENEPNARAYTEVPTTPRAFLKQRFRWSYGTLQCLWKHRRAMFRFGWFGWFLLPSIWLFQVLFQLVAPFLDLQVVWSLSVVLGGWVQAGLTLHQWLPSAGWFAPLLSVGLFYGLFYLLELGTAWIAFHLERVPRSALVWLFWQRVVYRVLLNWVMLRAIGSALAGTRQRWGKLQRRGLSHPPESDLPVPVSLPTDSPC
ncbi:Poly-beta-1,6-N-acetyl-D-glucosamine synthase [bacterium HR15]|nr:Poly-beta-1,6-N-acetyl-D-glucosamine synthase [bacterium HR15]